MNTRDFQVLRDLLQWQQARVYAHMPRSRCVDLFTRRPSSRLEARTFCIQLNIQGPGHLADTIGAQLSDGGIYLQDPSWKETGLTYYNPQVLKLEGLEDIDVWLRELALEPGDAQTANADIDWSTALDGLAQLRASSGFHASESLNNRLVEDTRLMR